MAGHARESDFSATAPWAGITGKPSGFTPTKHAYTHQAGGDDPVFLAISQIIGLAQELADKANSNVRINGHPLTGNVILTKADIGLGQVDNTSDINKPVSTAQQAAIDAAVANAMPSGAIMMWSGLLVDLPSAFLLCDGTLGTPDLRDKFIKGCADGIDPGVTGGAELHTPTGTNEFEEAHSHSVTSNVTATFSGSPAAAASTNGTPDLVAADTSGAGVSPVTTASGSVNTVNNAVTSGPGSAHTHTWAGDEADYQPAFYTLAFIMKR